MQKEHRNRQFVIGGRLSPRKIQHMDQEQKKIFSQEHMHDRNMIHERKHRHSQRDRDRDVCKTRFMHAVIKQHHHSEDKIIHLPNGITRSLQKVYDPKGGDPRDAQDRHPELPSHQQIFDHQSHQCQGYDEDNEFFVPSVFFADHDLPLGVLFFLFFLRIPFCPFLPGVFRLRLFLIAFRCFFLCLFCRFFLRIFLLHHLRRDLQILLQFFVLFLKEFLKIPEQIHETRGLQNVAIGL